jgi:hypothetical protein
MIVIHYKSKDIHGKVNRETHNWNMSKPVEDMFWMNYHNDIYRIDVNGEELEHILKLYSNIPTPSGDYTPEMTVSWFGDTAKFIIGNYRRVYVYNL